MYDNNEKNKHLSNEAKAINFITLITNEVKKI